MKLRYDKNKEFRILYPVDLHVKRGTIYETTDQDVQKRLIELGFYKVEQNKDKNKDGDK